MSKFVDIEELRNLYDKEMMITLIDRRDKTNINVTAILESIKEECGKHEKCNDCLFSKDYGDPKRYYCSIYDAPYRWQIDSASDAIIYLNTDTEKFRRC